MSIKRNRRTGGIHLVDRGAAAPHPATPPATRGEERRESLAHGRTASRTGRALTLAPAPSRAHTIVPTGTLDRRSAPILEAAIERIEDEVSRLTLDLRELTAIDATGIRVVAFRSRLCERRGLPVKVVPGSRLVRRAFEEAGIAALLAEDVEGGLITRRPTDVSKIAN
jgi:anti-anti-sigma factor